MSQKQAVVHDEIVEEYVPMCRHCKKTVDEHAQDNCLFEPTTWDPMNAFEWVAWRKSLWSPLRNIGTDYLRDQLRTLSFARQILDKQSLGAKK